MDLQEGMVTFLGRLAIRGSLCLLLVQMRSPRKGCTQLPFNTKKINFSFLPSQTPENQSVCRRRCPNLLRHGADSMVLPWFAVRAGGTSCSIVHRR